MSVSGSSDEHAEKDKQALLASESASDERVEDRIVRLKEDLKMLYEGLLNAEREQKMNLKLDLLRSKFAAILSQSDRIANGHQKVLHEVQQEFESAVERYQNSSNSSQIPQDLPTRLN